MSTTVLVRITDTGTGSKRITIPKPLLESKLGNSEFALISEREDGLLIRPAEVKAKKA
jgi:hypothetical protein